MSSSESRHSVATTPTVGVLLGVLWWIIGFLILADNGIAAAVVWIAVPYVVIAAHEAGHWLGARLSGISLAGTVVRVGLGPSVGVVNRNVRNGLLPGSGSVDLPASGGRRQTIAFLAGGIAGSFALAIVLAIVASGMTDTPVWIGLPALASLAVAIGNVLPVGGENVGRTDGLKIVRTLLGRQ